jgi:DNA mismatch endonuclease (patch repair protein)
MKGNFRRDTRPELRLRRELHSLGFRYRCQLRIIAGGTRVKPDVVFPRRRVAIFVDGCFWHGCPDHGNDPRANVGYWGPKLARNRERDRRVNDALAGSGWTVIRLWEHLTPREALALVLQTLEPAPVNLSLRPNACSLTLPT